MVVLLPMQPAAATIPGPVVTAGPTFAAGACPAPGASFALNKTIPLPDTFASHVPADGPVIATSTIQRTISRAQATVGVMHVHLVSVNEFFRNNDILDSVDEGFMIPAGFGQGDCFSVTIQWTLHVNCGGLNGGDSVHEHIAGRGMTLAGEDDIDLGISFRADGNAADEGGANQLECV